MTGDLSGLKLFRGQVANLITSMGGNSFEEASLRLLNGLFPIDLHTALVFDRNSNLIGITGASRRRKELAQSLSTKFYSKYWRGDLSLLGLRRERSYFSPRYWRTPWTKVPSEQMRQELYREAGIMEKLSVRSDVPSGFVIWNVYRQNDYFSDDEFNRLRDWAEVLSAAIANHLTVVQVSLPPAESDDGSILRRNFEQRGVHLSCRELSVCEGIASGATSKAIAADLGIKVSSVITYKRRIYEKFGISTQRELVGILLKGTLLQGGAAAFNGVPRRTSLSFSG